MSVKITKVELVAARHYLFVKVHTDEGIVGLGEAGNWGFLEATAGAVRKFSSFLVGQATKKLISMSKPICCMNSAVIMKSVLVTNMAIDLK